MILDDSATIRSQLVNDLGLDLVGPIPKLLDQLQEAVDAGEKQKIVDTTLALNAFYHPYCNNWDDKFKKAWDYVVKNND